MHHNLKSLVRQQRLDINIKKTLKFFNMNTIFKIGSKSHTLKYQRKMSEGEVNKMKSFITSKGEKLQKTNKFKIIEIKDSKDKRVFNLNL